MELELAVSDGVLTEEMEEELIELFPYMPNIIDRAHQDSYIVELLESRDLDALANYLES